jgi:dTDP-4-amino-4,6-dideoxygalactose transaminase
VAPLGPNVTGFEQDIEKYIGENLLSSGTAAIHLGLILLGVGRRSTLSKHDFAASANPILYLGSCIY